jgi:hypothetical protein
VFDQFDRSIVSIDTLKQDSQIRAAIEQSSWDLIIIDEAHNAAKRVRGGGNLSLRSKLAKLLSRKADSLLLLTATPHDGSRESFASLIEMLDPTRAPDPEKLHRDDIDDLVIRRFRTSPAVLAALKSTIPPRELHRRGFPLSEKEEAANAIIAELKLDLDMDSLDLFRTTLAKAIFSNPAACLETVKGRIARIERGTGKGSEADKQKLSDMAQLLVSIEPDDFRKYGDLLLLLKDIKWTGKDPRDRLVVFSERIRTLEWPLDNAARRYPCQAHRPVRSNVLVCGLQQLVFFGWGMKRRVFLSVFAGTVAWPLVAHARQSGKIWRIGFIAYQNFMTVPGTSLSNAGMPRDVPSDLRILLLRWFA